MKIKIDLKNWALLNSSTLYKNTSFKKEDILYYLENLLEKKAENNSIILDENFILKYKFIEEVDYQTIELYLVCKNNEYIVSNEELLNKFDELKINFSSINLEFFCVKNYIICDNYIDLQFSDKLLYNIYYKKIDEIRYIYSDIENNEFILNFLKHIEKFDIYYSKILKFYQKFSLSYPDLQKSNFKLVADYSKIIEWVNSKLDNDDLKELNKKINNLQAINLGLMYDLESLSSNLENLESRLKTIWWENSRYFLNHIEKAKFIIESFDSVLKKNNLIKENILQNYLEFVKNNIENQKLENDKNKINHIKNIKEILWWLAFVEIFINWLAEATKIFHLSENIAKILQNTAFMRMSLILWFIICYFIYIWYKKITLKK